MEVFPTKNAIMILTPRDGARLGVVVIGKSGTYESWVNIQELPELRTIETIGWANGKQRAAIVSTKNATYTIKKEPPRIAMGFLQPLTKPITVPQGVPHVRVLDEQGGAAMCRLESEITFNRISSPQFEHGTNICYQTSDNMMLMARVGLDGMITTPAHDVPHSITTKLIAFIDQKEPFAQDVQFVFNKV